MVRFRFFVCLQPNKNQPRISQIYADQNRKRKFDPCESVKSVAEIWLKLVGAGVAAQLIREDNRFRHLAHGLASLPALPLQGQIRLLFIQ